MNKHRKERSFRAFLSRNGFYIALVACVIVAAVASYSAVSSILSNLKDENTAIQDKTDPAPPVSVDPETPPTVEDEDPEKEANSDPGMIPVYVMPVEGTVTNPFSGDELVKNQTLDDWRTHNGVDIEAAAGTEVKAIYSGEIVRAGVDPLLGNFVEQKLDTGYTVIYANLGPITGLKAGDRISQGDVIGTVGNSAIIENGEPPHLHFEVKSGDKYIDPMSLFH